MKIIILHAELLTLLRAVDIHAELYDVSLQHWTQTILEVITRLTKTQFKQSQNQEKSF